MQRSVDWVKNNKFATFLLGVCIWYLAGNYSNRMMGYSVGSRETMAPYAGIGAGVDSYSMGLGMAKVQNTAYDSSLYPITNSAPTPQSNRMMVQNANIALLVKNVSEVQQQISTLVTSIGGYVVNRAVNRPTEQPYGTITVRIPVGKLEESLQNIKSMGLKVTNEEVSGYDVTDEYVDIETRLAYLRRSLAQIQAIQDKAEKFEEILQGTREVQNLQSQIDALLGQQNYIKQTAAYSLVSITMSTDEMALPYAPDTNFRPALIYKQAVRSLVVTLQDLAENMIWLGVYAVVWLPIGVILLIGWKVWKKKQS